MAHLSISVIIPAYRAVRTIRRAVDSALAQTLLPDEILIVDDGSPDDIGPALAGYPACVRLLRKPNGGAASARNFGIDHAGGELIAFLDADDYWEPAKLARQLDVLRRHPEVSLVASRYYEETPGKPRVAPGPMADALTGRPLRAGDDEVYDFITRIWTTTVIARRAVLAENRFVTGLEPAEDRDMWLRLASVAPVYILPDRLATAVLEPGSLSRSNVDRDRSNMLRVIERNAHLLRPDQRQKWETRVFRSWAADYLARRQPAQALAPAWNRIRWQPTSVEGWYILFKSALLATGVGRALGL
ncbi:hypothetical protein AYO44_04000 [Planctomycetaceae bacterium SCGC AG-212-F19]|nr:hypothetical protein AYO44_04000 [Planctomycetaceae bacterium SCGC AG-212-F19]